MKSSRVRLDFLAWRPLRTIVASPAFPVTLQILMVVVVVLLVMNGLGLGLDMSAEELKSFRKTNLTTLVVWGLWWPGMIVIALAFGRAWCTVCPMELINRAGDAIARKVGWPRARLGKFLRAGWMIIVIYLALQILVAGVSLHRVPHYTAILLLVLLSSAFLTGLVFREPRSFCRAFCPAGALLSVYGRYTPIQLEVRDPDVCETCPTKDCIREENRYKFDKRSCPSLLRPFDRQPSDGCVLCLQCVKVCPYENMGVGIVSVDAAIRRKVLLKPYEAAFVMVALGFVAHEVIGEVKWLDSVFHVIPAQFAALAPGISFGWIEALWFLVLFPMLVWGTISALAYVFGHRAGFRSLLLGAATGAAPVVAIAHLAKSTAKISSWGGFLPLALYDPTGAETFHGIVDHSLARPANLVGLPVVGWMMVILTAVIAWRALRWVREIPPDSIVAARAGVVFSAAIFSAVLSIWAWPAL